MLGRTTLKRAVDNLPDMLADPQYSRHHALAGGLRSVPRRADAAGRRADRRHCRMAKRARRLPRPLVETAADIRRPGCHRHRERAAVHRAGDAQRRADRSARAADCHQRVLRVISGSPTDVQPVFETARAARRKLCQADVAVVSRFDGGPIELAAIHGLNPEAVRIVRALYPMPVDAASVTARTVRDATVVHIPDVLAGA